MPETGVADFCLGVTLLATAGTAWAGCAPRPSVAAAGGSSAVADERLRSLQRCFLPAFAVAVFAGALQGLLYSSLYDAYGLSRSDASVLAAAGPGSAALLGTVVASLADRIGRRRVALVSSALCATSSALQHMNSFSALLLGRIVGGAALSAQLSVFESWLVSEHNCRNFESELLGTTLSFAVLGGGIASISACSVGGIVADYEDLTRWSPEGNLHYGGYTAPYDVAAGSATVCFFFLLRAWSENHGQKATKPLMKSTREAVVFACRTLSQQPSVLHCGIACSCCEASIMVFCVAWGPALGFNSSSENGDGDSLRSPLMHTFAALMSAFMLGSQVFSILARSMALENLGRAALLVAAASHLTPVLLGSSVARFLAFWLFGLCMGTCIPAFSLLKAQFMPEEVRSTAYSLCRVLPGMVVVATLMCQLGTTGAFLLGTFLLLAALVSQSRLIAAQSPYKRVGGNDNDNEFGLEDDDNNFGAEDLDDLGPVLERVLGNPTGR